MAGEQAEPGRAARAIAERKRHGFALVSIDGPGGAGKSTLAAVIARHLSPGPVAVVHGDDFYRPMAADKRLLLSPQEGCDQYFDWQRLRDQVLTPLASGRAAHYQRYDWPTGVLAPGERLLVPRTGTVIIEGGYTARPELTWYYGLTIMVQTPRDVRVRRQRQRGHDHGPGNWIERWRASEDYYLSATRPATRLDLVITGL